MTRAHKIVTILASASILSGLSACGDEATERAGTAADETNTTSSPPSVTPDPAATIEASDAQSTGGESAPGTSETTGATDPSMTTTAVSPSSLPLVSPTNAVDGGIVYGENADAPKVGVYLDFQCPYCGVFSRGFSEELNKLAADGTIQLSIHPMSFLDQMLQNDSSHRMANAFACAADVGKGLEFEAAAFKSQPEEGKGYSNALVTQIVKEAGITGDDLETYKVCEDEEAYMGWVNTVDAAAAAAGVTGTPTVMVNGKPLDLTALTGEPGQLTELIKTSAKS